MQKIGIVDDRKESRESIRISIELTLESLDRDWEVIDIYPLADLHDYSNWLRENEIAVLILDERLQEEPSESGNTVGYKGHELTVFLRQTLKEFPIYVITAFKNDSDLQEKFKEVDGIIGRHEFTEREEDYLTQMLRAGNRFWNENISQLEQIASLAKKIAIGESNDDDIAKLNSLQTKLEIPHLYSNISNKKEFLDEFESSIDKMEALKQKIKDYLSNK